jgi:pentatricopeptide repeat protein
MPDKATELFKQIQNPNDIIRTLLFNACAQLRTNEALELVKSVVSTMPASPHKNLYLVTSLLDALMKFGDIAQAQSLFDAFEQKVESMYGAMMKGYIANDMPDKAIDLFRQVQNPNEVMIILLFNACAQTETVEGLNLVKNVVSKTHTSDYSNVRLLTSLLDAFMKCGAVEEARLRFDAAPNKVIPMYAAIISGELYIGRRTSALILVVFRLQEKQPAKQSSRSVYWHRNATTASRGDSTHIRWCKNGCGQFQDGHLPVRYHCRSAAGHVKHR